MRYKFSFRIGGKFNFIEYVCTKQFFIGEKTADFHREKFEK